jgi:hypothetical protein
MGDAAVGYVYYSASGAPNAHMLFRDIQISRHLRHALYFIYLFGLHHSTGALLGGGSGAIRYLIEEGYIL